MSRLPTIDRKHKICVICEGYEESAYFERLCGLGIWSDVYAFFPVNSKSASNIPARFQDAFQNDKYELILIFCDTDKYPYTQYSMIKKKINDFLNRQKAHEKLIIFANPCTMQIILSHFGDVALKNQGKKTNAAEIEKLTGVQNYDAHDYQIEEICKKIFKRSYNDMKQRVRRIDLPDTTPCSTNFYPFLELFENDAAGWISAIQRYILREKT